MIEGNENYRQNSEEAEPMKKIRLVLALLTDGGMVICGEAEEPPRRACPWMQQQVLTQDNKLSSRAKL